MVQSRQTLPIYTLRISEHHVVQGTRDQLIERLMGGLMKGCNQVAAWVDAKLAEQTGARV